MKEFIVGIDKGHTKIGKDPGALGQTGQQEGKTNSNVGDEVIRVLKSRGVIVVDINPSGGDLSINERVNLLIKARVNISVSVHHNASDGKGKGMEVFAEVDDSESVRLANLVLDELKDFNSSRGVKTSRSTVNPSKNKLGMLNVPNSINILIEAAFIDNSEDIKRIDTLTEQKLEGLLIAQAIMKFIGIEIVETKPIVVPTPIVAPTDMYDKLVVAKIISSPTYWRKNCVEGGQVKGEFARAVILNFYTANISGKVNFEEALNYALDNEIVSSLEYWKENCVSGRIVRGEYMKIVISRIEKILK